MRGKLNSVSPVCEYDANKNAWMTSMLFNSWLKKWNSKLQSEGRRILLLVDNCSAHNLESKKLSQIRVEFLPPNTTNVLQPCDQGIIELAKRGFRRRLIEFIMQEMDKDEDATAPKLVKKVTLLNAIHWMTESWNDLSATTISRC